MNSHELLELCLSVSGSFENGDPAYDAITGNSDGMGISVGVLQWNAGAGSLAVLLSKIIQYSSSETVNAFFTNGEDVASMARMSPTQALQYTREHFLQGEALTPVAVQEWQGLISSEPGIKAQVDLATNGILAHAIHLAQQYTPTVNSRDICFFFDILTQSGGMGNSRGSVQPCNLAQANYLTAIQVAQSKSPKTAQYWTTVCQNDSQARLLLHYAYHRALLSRPDYQWDGLSRRGAIACRGGVVHGCWFDFSTLP